MAENNVRTTRSRKRGRVGLILLLLLSLLLCLCLGTSCTANLGTVGWALWTQYELRQSEEEAAALQSDLERLRGLLEENEIEIPVSPANAQRMDDIEEQVIGLRGLQPMTPVTRTLISRDELYQQTLEEFEEFFSPEEARDYALALAAFDMIDPQIDLYTVYLNLYTEQISGFYDPEVKQIYIIAGAGPLGEAERLTYAHEYTHALQDQHFDLEGLGLDDEGQETLDSEALAGLQALVEGDASLLQSQYLDVYFSPQETLALMRQSLEAEIGMLQGTPDVIVQSLYFPYQNGLRFVEALYEQGGWAAVDAAYARPPLSTEHILHPERYRSLDQPQAVSLPPLTDTLGAGWRLVDEDILGEFFTRYYLAQSVATSIAEEAAEGWGGDRYAVYYRDDDAWLAMALHTVWDTPGDMEEFVDAYAGYAGARFDVDAEQEGARLCWVAADAICLTWEADSTTVARGPDQETVLRILEAVAGD